MMNPELKFMRPRALIDYSQHRKLKPEIKSVDAPILMFKCNRNLQANRSNERVVIEQKD